SKFVISSVVRSALNANKGVVALESTVITHGLPYPQNIETAKLLEDTVRSEGSVPATIAVLDGQIHIGLSDEKLTRVAETMDAVKVSRRDIAYALCKGVIGGTTVAATMFLANIAGIRVFATGGIGGVHRGAEQTFDVSADLLELSHTPLTVVCAGVKSILDISKTVEFLETHSVNCIVFGERNVFPGFFSRESHSKGQFNTENLAEVVEHIEASKELGLNAGIILACPIPKEMEDTGNAIEAAVQTALNEAKIKGIQSKEVTPFLLSRVNELTCGASMKLNIDLLENNARIAGQLASLLSKSKLGQNFRVVQDDGKDSEQKSKAKIVVVGATIIDFESITNEDVKNDGGTYAGWVAQRCGGVGRNHADALTRLGCDVSFISAIGDDDNGKYFLNKCPHINSSRVLIIGNASTAIYLSVNVGGEVLFGISSHSNIINKITPDVISQHEHVISSADYIFFDGNIPTEAIRKTLDLSAFYNRKVWFDPASISKMRKIFDCEGMNQIQVVSPNANEFMDMVKRSRLKITHDELSSPHKVCEFVCGNPQIMYNLEMLIVTLSSNGTAVVTRRTDGSLSPSILPPAIEHQRVVSVSGAGDSLNSGILAGLVNGLPLERCLQIGQTCAARTLLSVEAVSPSISPEIISP
ncbi:hypothetical protein Angca_008498, partial [Angiostrongylus cantonensis]